MFALDVVSKQEEPIEDSNDNKTLQSINLAHKLHISSAFKPTKQQFLDLLVDIQQHEKRIAKASTHIYRRRAKKILINPVALRHFVYYCRALKLADKQLSIDPIPSYQTAIVFLIGRLLEFFHRSIQKIGGKEEQFWDQELCKLGFSKDDAQIYISIQMLTNSRLSLYKTRRKAERVVRNQKFMRKEAIERDKAAKLPELLPWDPSDMKNLEKELLRSELLDMDDACLIIQCVERMYQAIARGIYLFEVRRKALNLHNDDASDIDSTKSIIKIQAITRGFLARKLTKQMREEEKSKLGMEMEFLLNKRTAARQRRTEYPPSSPYLLDRVPNYIEVPADFKLPKTFTALMDLLHQTLFIVDPLDSFIDKKKNTEVIGPSNDRETELILGRLISHEVATLGHNYNSNKPDIPFDELISYTVSVQILSDVFFFDLRNFFYLTVILPHVFCSWPKLYFKRFNLLISGNPNSGKHTWVKSMAQKLGAIQIILNKKTLAKRRRTKTIKDIKDFCMADKFAFIVFENLEIYNERFANKTAPFKKFYFELMKSLVEDVHINAYTQFIGIARRSNLEQDVLSLFNATLTLTNPKSVERFELIAESISVQHEERPLKHVPQRLLEISHSTKALNCGQTIQKVDRKLLHRSQ